MLLLTGPISRLGKIPTEQQGLQKAAGGGWRARAAPRGLDSVEGSVFPPTGWRKSSDTLELPGHVGLCFSWSKQAELGCPLAPSPIPVQGGGVTLLETATALLTAQQNSIPRRGSGEMEGPYVPRCSLYTAPCLNPCLAASHGANRSLSCSSSFIVPEVLG